MKTYHLRLTGSEILDVPEAEYRPIEDAIMQKSERMIKAAGVVFSPRDVKRVTSTYHVEVPAGFAEAHPEITEEVRQTNLRRMRWIRAYMFKRGVDEMPEEEKDGYAKFVAWYESPKQVERRASKKAFHAEFFDVYFKDHDEEDATYKAWLEATNESADPRAYNRDNLTPTALGSRELSEAKEPFNS